MKKRLVTILCLIAVLAAGFILSCIPDEREWAAKESKAAEINEENYILKEYNGRIALFTKGKSKPHMIFNVYTDNLPDMDKFKLKDGIEAKSREELRRLIEDLTS